MYHKKHVRTYMNIYYPTMNKRGKVIIDLVNLKNSRLKTTVTTTWNGKKTVDKRVDKLKGWSALKFYNRILKYDIRSF